MSDLVPGWEAGKAAAIAPDESSAKAARRLALPASWAGLGSDGAFAWGLLAGSGSKPYQVMLDLGSLATAPFTYRCSCPSRKQPCKHVLALLIIAAEQPGALGRHEAPAPFVAEWLARRAERAASPAKSKKAPGAKQQEKSAAARREKIAAGLEELEPWLFDVLRQGLGDSRLKSYQFWETRAARLVDAQAPGLAGRLRALAAGGMQRADYGGWAAATLGELGQVYLALQGFRRYETLPAALQADLRTALGWPARQEELAGEPAVHDRWLVLGRREELVEQRLRQQRLWLHGLETGSFALILEFAFGSASFETSLQPGEKVEAALVYYPGGAPLRAFAVRAGFKPARSSSAPGPERSPSPYVGEGKHVPSTWLGEGRVGVGAALLTYAEALAANPWLLQYPFLLGPVWLQRAGHGWLARDEAGEALPLARAYAHGWSLLALSGGQPLTLFGEWDGRSLLPLAALSDGRLVDLTSLEAR